MDYEEEVVYLAAYDCKDEVTHMQGSYHYHCLYTPLPCLLIIQQDSIEGSKLDSGQIIEQQGAEMLRIWLQYSSRLCKGVNSSVELVQHELTSSAPYYSMRHLQAKLDNAQCSILWALLDHKTPLRVGECKPQEQLKECFMVEMAALKCNPHI